MAEQPHAPISHADVDRLYVGDWAPESWLDLEVRVVQLLEKGEVSAEQSRALVHGLNTLSERGRPVPADAGELYLELKPVLEALTSPIA